MKKALNGFIVERNFRTDNAKGYYSEALQPEEERCIGEQIREAKNHWNQARAERERLAEQLQSAKELAEAQAEAFRKWQIALEIASRIMRGDNVPLRDKEFLLEQSPGLYKLAMTTRNFANENPEDHEALSPDECSSGSGEGYAQDIGDALSAQTSASSATATTISSSSSTTTSSSSSTSTSSVSSGAAG